MKLSFATKKISAHRSKTHSSSPTTAPVRKGEVDSTSNISTSLATDECCKMSPKELQSYKAQAAVNNLFPRAGVSSPSSPSENGLSSVEGSFAATKSIPPDFVNTIAGSSAGTSTTACGTSSVATHQASSSSTGSTHAAGSNASTGRSRKRLSGKTARASAKKTKTSSRLVHGIDIRYHKTKHASLPDIITVTRKLSNPNISRDAFFPPLLQRVSGTIEDQFSEMLDDIGVFSILHQRKPGTNMKLMQTAEPTGCRFPHRIILVDPDGSSTAEECDRVMTVLGHVFEHFNDTDQFGALTITKTVVTADTDANLLPTMDDFILDRDIVELLGELAQAGMIQVPVGGWVDLYTSFDDPTAIWRGPQFPFIAGDFGYPRFAAEPVQQAVAPNVVVNVQQNYVVNPIGEAESRSASASNNRVESVVRQQGQLVDVNASGDITARNAAGVP